jgi:hypothetical protein
VDLVTVVSEQPDGTARAEASGSFESFVAHVGGTGEHDRKVVRIEAEGERVIGDALSRAEAFVLIDLYSQRHRASFAECARHRRLSP